MIIEGFNIVSYIDDIENNLLENYRIGNICFNCFCERNQLLQLFKKYTETKNTTYLIKYVAKSIAFFNYNCEHK